jgi:RecQ helicase-like protein
MAMHDSPPSITSTPADVRHPEGGLRTRRVVDQGDVSFYVDRVGQVTARAGRDVVDVDVPLPEPAGRPVQRSADGIPALLVCSPSPENRHVIRSPNRKECGPPGVYLGHEPGGDHRARAVRDGRSSTLELLSLDVTWDAHALAALATPEVETHREDEVERTRLAMMRRYAEHTGCRRSFLLSYFGQDYRGPCGNCDNDLAHSEAERAEVPFAVGARVMSERWARARSSGTTATRSRCCSTSTATASCSCRWCSSAACCGLREAQASRSRRVSDRRSAPPDW